MSRFMISAATATMFLLGTTTLVVAQQETGELPSAGAMAEQSDMMPSQQGNRMQGDRGEGGDRMMQRDDWSQDRRGDGMRRGGHMGYGMRDGQMRGEGHMGYDMRGDRMRGEGHMGYGMRGDQMRSEGHMGYGMRGGHMPMMRGEYGPCRMGPMGKMSDGQGGFGMGPRMMLMMMALVDTDGSRTISLEEMQAVHERMFNYIDADGDGELTIEEIRDFMQGGGLLPSERNNAEPQTDLEESDD